MKNPISMAVAGAYVWAVNAADELYVHATALDGPWHLVTTSGAITKVTASQGTNYGLAIVGGKVYRLTGGITTPDEMPGLPGAPSDIAASAYYAYVLMPAGTWWWRPLVGSTAWVQLTGGDYPWALVGGALYYGTTTSFFPADSAGVLAADGGVEGAMADGHGSPASQATRSPR